MSQSESKWAYRKSPMTVEESLDLHEARLDELEEMSGALRGVKQEVRVIGRSFVIALILLTLLFGFLFYSSGFTIIHVVEEGAGLGSPQCPGVDF